MRDLSTGLALVLVIEGILYALFPEGMKRVAARAMLVPPQILRASGLLGRLSRRGHRLAVAALMWRGCEGIWPTGGFSRNLAWRAAWRLLSAGLECPATNAT